MLHICPKLLCDLPIWRYETLLPLFRYFAFFPPFPSPLTNFHRSAFPPSTWKTFLVWGAEGGGGGEILLVSFWYHK